jgi:alpha-glucosidase
MFTTYRKFPSRILEITFKKDGESVLPESPAVVMKPMATVNNLISFSFFNSWLKKDSENHYSFSSTNGLWGEMEIREKPKGFEIKIRIDPEDGIFGFGEEIGALNKRGKVYEMYNTDEPDHSPTKTRLYSSFPVFMILSPKKSLGFFLDHPGYSRFDLAFTKENKIISDVEG